MRIHLTVGDGPDLLVELEPRDGLHPGNPEKQVNPCFELRAQDAIMYGRELIRLGNEAEAFWYGFAEYSGEPPYRSHMIINTHEMPETD